MKLNFSQEWQVGKQFDKGGFGKVFHATGSDSQKVVAKFIPKAPGAQREMLFVDLKNVRNVIPILDSGETDDDWVLIMPLAEKSLRQLLDDSAPLSVNDASTVAKDVLDALVDLQDKVVHRDIKPANILFYEGKWCLADFGISRYAEATTASDTQKYAMSPPYASPEQWRAEHATPAADVYSTGVVIYEMLANSLPFPGPASDDYREQHLHDRPPEITGIPSPFADIVDEMLYKAPGARPQPANLAARLEKLTDAKPAIVIEALQQANRTEVERRSDQAAQASAARTRMQSRQELQAVAAQSLEKISLTLRDAIMDSAPAAELARGSGVAWFIRLNQATLELPPMSHSLILDWDWAEPPDIDVVATAELNLRTPVNQFGKEGRSHSLWFCDAKTKGHYEWYETGFMYSVLIPKSTTVEPLAFEPGTEAAKALWNGSAEWMLAWPFTPLKGDDLVDFVNRWGGWFATASVNGYQPPSQMPERPTQGSYRT